MSLWEHYHRPETIEEALALLAQHQGRARLVGGGTDLLLEMQQAHRPPVEALVDVTAITGLDQISRDGKWIVVGAAARHSQIVASDLIREQATCLVESCGVIGGPQVRNVGTLGGNVAHALPAADGTTALVALDGQAEVAFAGGREWRPILSLFHGPGVSGVDQTAELISRFRFQSAQPSSGTAFKRIMRPQGVALPILACAVWVRVQAATDQEAAGQEVMIDEAIIEETRICIGPVRPTPTRADQAEEVLRGRSLGQALADVKAAAREQFSPRTSRHRATSAYRTEMMDVLLDRSLRLAVRRAVTGEAVPEGIGLQ